MQLNDEFEFLDLFLQGAATWLFIPRAWAGIGESQSEQGSPQPRNRREV